MSAAEARALSQRPAPSIREVLRCNPTRWSPWHLPLNLEAMILLNQVINSTLLCDASDLDVASAPTGDPILNRLVSAREIVA
jgi:hypothetical protein